MCGYCTEGIAIRIMQNEWEFDSEMASLEMVHCLQELEDLKQAIEYYRQVRSNLHPDVVGSCDEVIMCRLIYHLFKNSFDEEYRQLAQLDLVRAVIREKCVLNDSFRSFLSSGFKIQTPGFLPLYEESFYLEPSRWEIFFSSAGKWMDEYKQILSTYYKWWYLGQNLKKGKDCRRVEDRVICDALFARDENECSRFFIVFRSLFFSALLVANLPDSQIAIQNIIEGGPHYLVDFDGMDLWLQRVAIFEYGTSFKPMFYEMNKMIRLQLIYYYVHSAKLSNEERIKIAETIEHLYTSLFKDTHWVQKELDDWIPDIKA